MNYDIECPKHGRLAVSTRRKNIICPVCDGQVKVNGSWKRATPFRERLAQVRESVNG